MNEVGHEAGNALVAEGRELPWLQDADLNANSLSDVWTESWDITFRDVVILDGQNKVVSVYNLTSHDLGNPDNFAEPIPGPSGAESKRRKKNAKQIDETIKARRKLDDLK